MSRAATSLRPWPEHGLLDDALDSGLHSLLEAGLSHRWIVAGGPGWGPVQGLADEIDALRMIFMVNERAMFEFVVTEASLREVVNRTRPGYTQWVYDVLDTWLYSVRGRGAADAGHYL